MIRLVIADDHPVVRAGLRALLETDPLFVIVAEAATPAEAERLAREHLPDVVLMDLQFGELETGADATRAIRALPRPPAVLVLTNYDTDADILSAVEAGASGYLLKDSPPADLLAAVRSAAAGESALSPAVAGRLLDRMRSPGVSVSARELEVLAAVSAGLSNVAISVELRISEATVKSHLAHVYTKLDVSSRSAAVARARDLGLLR